VISEACFFTEAEESAVVFISNRLYVGYQESKFRWAIEKKQEFILKPFILPFDVHTLHYFLT
jgi:hypothetical protein